MSETLEYRGHEPRRGWAISEIAAWGVIVAAIVTLLVVTFTVRRTSPAASKGPAAPLVIQARYHVGASQFLKDRAYREQLGKALEKEAKTPADQFRAAIVRGEVLGKDAEEKEMSRLRHEFPELEPDVELLERFYRQEAGAQEWQSFRERHGWFADLAEARDKPGNDPHRGAVLHAAERTVGVLLGFFLLLGVAGLAGVVLLIVGIIFVVMKRLRLRFRETPPGERTAYIEAFALYLGIMIFASLAARWLILSMNVSLGAWTNGILPLAFVVALAWPLVRGQTWLQWRRTVGLHTGKGLFWEIGSGLVGYIAGIPLVAIGIVITALLSKLGGVDVSHPIVQEMTSHGPRLWLWLALASVWAPITEEVMFRGMLFAHLRERFGFWVSAIGVAVVFAIIHPQGWAGVPALASIAIVLAWIREWRGSIVGSMAAHALNNTAVMLMMLGALS